MGTRKYALHTVAFATYDTDWAECIIEIHNLNFDYILKYIIHNLKSQNIFYFFVFCFKISM